MRSLDAPTTLPLTQPKSSVSRRVSGRRAHGTATNGPEARLLAACTALARSDLPVPGSPEMTAGASVAARHAMSCRTRLKAALCPMSGGSTDGVSGSGTQSYNSAAANPFSIGGRR